MKYYPLICILFFLISCEKTTEIIHYNNPTNLEAEFISTTEVSLNWQDNSDNELGFIIERKDLIDYEVIDTLGANSNAYIDTDINLLQEFKYRVAAFFDDMILAYSNEDSVCYFNSPYDIYAHTNIYNNIVLEWSDINTLETGFILQRKTENLQFVTIDSLLPDSYSFDDDNVELYVNYTYRIAAIFVDGISEWSSESDIYNKPIFEGLEFGSESTFDIVSWNIEHFPKANQVTLDYLESAIISIDADVYCLQEIEDSEYFNSLLYQINESDIQHTWEGFRANSASYDINIAYIYKSDVIEVIEIYEIYSSYEFNRQFPRRPLLMNCSWNGEPIVIINNHLKALGDGFLDLGDEWDEETRRYDACNLLDEYIADYLNTDNVILIGDLNDELIDEQQNNVFWNLLQNHTEYYFVDLVIAEGDNSNWSYPSWPSHLDHILISNELFDEFADSNSEVRTLKIDEYLDGGFYEYDENISDHRPVGLKLYFQ